MLKPTPSHVEGPPLEVEIDWAKTKLLLAKRVRYWSYEARNGSLNFEVEQFGRPVEGEFEPTPSRAEAPLPKGVLDCFEVKLMVSKRVR